MLSTHTTIRPAPPPRQPARQQNGQTCDERTLLAGLIADDERAWREFNARYARLIYRCITRVTARFSNVVGAEDVREIHALLCIQLLANDKHKLRSFKPERGSKFGSWVGMLAIHSAYDYLRQLKREPKRTALGEAEQLRSSSPDPYETYKMRQRARIVATVLGQFSDKDRLFIRLYFGQGLDPQQVAQRMSISVKTVYTKRHKIQTRLETLLAERQLAA